MATSRQGVTTSTLSLQTENGTTTSSRTKPVSMFVKSDKTTGGFVTFPDGSKFRLPTTYSVRQYSIQGGSPNIQKGEYKGPNAKPNSIRNVESSPGGYNDDDLIAANCPGYAGITTNKLYDSPSFPTGMVNEAVTKALNNIADQKAGIGEDLATMRQTINMIKNPASALLGSLRSAWNDKSLRPYLRRSVRDLRRQGIPETIAGKYLEYVYGWIPLMSDIKGVVELMKEQGQRPLLLSGKGVSNQETGKPGSSYYNASYRCRSTWITAKENAKVSCKLYGRIDPDATGLRTLNQLGLLNPLSLVYELTPWSFVVDWFVPIGPVLNALTAPAGLKFVAGTRSVKSSFIGTYEHKRDPYGSVVYSNIPGTGVAQAQRYSRQTYSNWPLPGFYFSSDPFAGDRPLKALALGIVNLRSLRI